MKFFQAINNFTSGKWSPKMHARTDVQQYQNASSDLKNVVVQVQGGAFRRAGTEYIDLTDNFKQDALDAVTSVRIIPFGSRGSDHLLVIPEGTVADWFITNAHGIVKTVIVKSGVLSSFFLSAADLEEIQYEQIGDVLILTTGGATPPVVLVPAFGILSEYEIYPWMAKTDGSGAIAYPTIAGLAKWEAVPYSGFENSTTRGNLVVAGTMTVGGAVTVTFPNAEFPPIVGSVPFPKYVRITAAAKTAVLEIQSITSATVGTGVVVYNPDSVAAGTFGTTAGTFWESGLWGPSTRVSSFPECVASFEQRLYFAATPTHPETVWGSLIGNILKFMRVPYAQSTEFSSFSSNNAYPYSFTLANRSSSYIKALSGVKSLVINTDGGEAVAYTSSGGALGALDISIDTSTSFGSAKVQPYRVNNFLTFVQKGGRRVRDVVFSFEQDQYKSNDLAFVADDLTHNGDYADQILCLAKVEEPSSTLYAKTDSGRILALTLDRDYQVNAWSELALGGTLDDGPPKVLSIAVLTNVLNTDINSRETLFAVVRRTVNGENRTFIERFAPLYEADSTVALYPMIYTDCTRVLNQTASVTAPGFTHLANETVDVVADGQYVGSLVVSNTGVITLPRAAERVVAGLPYETIITPLPVETGTQLGSPLGITKKIDEITIKFWKSYGCQYGRPGEQLTEIDFRDPSAPMGDPVQLFTGDKRVNFPAGYDRRAQVTIRQSKPFPCNVLAIVSKGVTYD